MKNGPSIEIVRQYLALWEKTYPDIGRKIYSAIAGNSSGVGNLGTSIAVDQPPVSAPINVVQDWGTKILDAAERIIPTYWNYKMQKGVTDLQLERARQGLSPIDYSQYRAPPVVMRHEIDPYSITTGLSDETKTVLWIGGGIAAAFLILPKLVG